MCTHLSQHQLGAEAAQAHGVLRPSSVGSRPSAVVHEELAHLSQMEEQGWPWNLIFAAFPRSQQESVRRRARSAAPNRHPLEECTTLSTLAAEAKLQFAEAYEYEDTDVDPPARLLDARIVFPMLLPLSRHRLLVPRRRPGADRAAAGVGGPHRLGAVSVQNSRLVPQRFSKTSFPFCPARWIVPSWGRVKGACPLLGLKGGVPPLLGLKGGVPPSGNVSDSENRPVKVVRRPVRVQHLQRQRVRRSPPANPTSTGRCRSCRKVGLGHTLPNTPCAPPPLSCCG